MRPYYEDDSATIYHGDALDVLPLLDGVSCTVTSPPYNTLTGSTVSGGGMHKRSGWSAKVRSTGYADGMSETDYWTWQGDVAAGIAEATVAGGSFFYNHKLRYRESQPIIPADFVRAWTDWTLRQELIWARDGSMVFNARMFPPCDERIYWMVRAGADHKWNQDAGNQWLSVWRIRQEVGLDGHPCPYPLALPTRCVLATTDPHDLILDPFMGSGTTLRAAKDCGRRAVGIELREDYCEVAAKRLAQEVLDFGESA